MAQVIPQATPNPNAFKFTLDGHSFDRPITLSDAGAAAGTPFEALFGLPGVVGVFATANFVTLTKDPGTEWSQIVDSAKQVLEKSF